MNMNPHVKIRCQCNFSEICLWSVDSTSWLYSNFITMRWTSSGAPMALGECNYRLSRRSARNCFIEQLLVVVRLGSWLGLDCVSGDY